jgi:hypothetical protein
MMHIDDGLPPITIAEAEAVLRQSERGLTEQQVWDLATEAIDRWRDRASDAMRFYRRRIAPIPERPLLGALAGWRHPWAAEPTDPPLAPGKGPPALRGALIVLAGVVGTGKSSTAARWLLRDERPDRARWVRALDLDRYGDTADDAVYWATREPRRVVIDDVAQGTAVEHRRVAEILLARSDAKRPTCVTTNATRIQFAQAIGDRVLDRVECWLDLPGESKRSGSQADQWRAEMDRVEAMYQTRLRPFAAAWLDLLEARGHGLVRMRHLEALVALDTSGGHGDAAWLDGRVAALLAAQEGET